MNILIVGASGRTGMPLLRQALAEGHSVVAYVRNPSKVAVQHPNLRVVAGQMGDGASLEAAVSGQDAVLSALGPVRGGNKHIMETAARELVSAMQKTAVRRIVSLTGAGVAQPGDEPKAFNRLMSLALGLLARDVLLDSTRHAEILRSSGLDWTLVRVPMLQDGPMKGQYRVGMVGLNDGPRIHRADVAHFMLRALQDNSLIGRSPVIAY